MAIILTRMTAWTSVTAAMTQTQTLGGSQGSMQGALQRPGKSPAVLSAVSSQLYTEFAFWFSWVQLEDCRAGLQAELHVLSCFSAAGH